MAKTAKPKFIKNAKPKKQPKAKAEPSANGKGKPAKSSPPRRELGNGTPPDESLKAIAKAEVELQKAEAEYEDAKIDAREAKAKKEKLRKKLHDIIHEETGLEPTLWNVPREDSKPSPARDAASSNPTATDDEVRKATFRSLGLKPGLCDKLEKAGIETLGNYYDYVKPSNSGFQKRLVDLKGIGAATVTEVENCEMEYVAELAKRRAAKASEVVNEVADATVPPPEPADPTQEPHVSEKQKEAAARVEEGATS